MVYCITGPYFETVFVSVWKKIKNYVNKPILFYSDCRFFEIWDLSCRKLNSRFTWDLKLEIPTC